MDIFDKLLQAGEAEAEAPAEENNVESRLAALEQRVDELAALLAEKTEEKEEKGEEDNDC